ncbi:MAG: hypothetical protein Q4A28_05375 [Brachymonas sp.]|nr:hypothetical protein [Brachymonas sp.]
MKKLAMMTGALALAFSASAFAQSGGLEIPGLASVKGSSGSEVKNSTINIMKNKSNKVSVGGGSAGGYGVSANLTGQANVNSVQLINSKINESTVNVMDNESGEVTAIGGQANVNSLQLQ